MTGKEMEVHMDGQGTGEQTIIREDVEIVGTIKAAGSVKLEGKLNGDLNSASDVAIGKSANVKGNMTVSNVTVQGHIVGNITARDKIELKATARINGDVRAKRMTVEDGVSFVGKVEVNPAGISAQPRADESASAQEQTEGDQSAGNSDRAERSKGLPFLGRK